jgi:hypothetical protein
MGLKIIIPKGLGFLLVHLYDFFVYMKDEWDSTKKNLQIFSILLNKSPKQHGHGNIQRKSLHSEEESYELVNFFERF